MGTSTKAGFTIIETMLFLAITGLLIATMLVGIGTSINIQRYHDSVTSLESTIQQLYSQSIDVVNDRSASLSCNSNAVTSNSGVGQPVGQSDCLIIGQYMTIINGDTSISTVLGYPGSDDSTGDTASDITELKAYKLALLDSSTVPSSIDWGATLAWPATGTGAKSPTTPRSIAILVLRSPTSGRIYTFTSDDPSTALTDMIVAGNTVPGQALQRLCIDSGSAVAVGLGIVIDADASSANAIEMRSNDMGDNATC